MTVERARRLVPKSVHVSELNDGRTGVALSRNGSVINVLFVDYDDFMNNAALFAVVYRPAVDALKHMKVA